MKRYLLALATLIASLLLVLLQERLSTDVLFAQAVQARPEAQQLDPVSLEESIAPLVRYFNQGKQKPRLLVLLSPT